MVELQFKNQFESLNYLTRHRLVELTLNSRAWGLIVLVHTPELVTLSRARSFSQMFASQLYSMRFLM